MLLMMKNLGYFGNFSIALLSIFLSIVYLVFAVKEPLKKKPEAAEKNPEPARFGETLKSILKSVVVKPVLSMVQLFSRKRLGLVVHLLLIAYAVFAVAFQVQLFFIFVDKFSAVDGI